MSTIRKHLLFYGEVQGVGFRWRAKHTAEAYHISGWVKNLYNGSVEMEAEGTPQDIDALVYALEHARWIYIDRIDAKEIPTEGGPPAARDRGALRPHGGPGARPAALGPGRRGRRGAGCAGRRSAPAPQKEERLKRKYITSIVYYTVD